MDASAFGELFNFIKIDVPVRTDSRWRLGLGHAGTSLGFSRKTGGSAVEVSLSSAT